MREAFSVVRGRVSIWRRGGLFLAAFGLTFGLSALGASDFAPPAQAQVKGQVNGVVSLADLAARVSDAVVNISASTTETSDVPREMPDIPKGTPFENLFRQFFNRQLQRQKDGDGGDDDNSFSPRETSLGSGFVIDPSGVIITNNHVIEGANDITVIFTNGDKLKAKVVGRDEKVDVAVLRVKPAAPLKFVKFGDSGKMRVGDPVMAVGNPFGLGGTVTAGIVSARNRVIDNGPYDDYIQTDAAINKGNSGGPLFNMAGDVIGINTAILSPSGGSIGIGFATPASEVVPIIDQLMKYGKVRRGWLGVHVQQVDDSIADSLGLHAPQGALIASIDGDGPAKPAGLKPGDVIVSFNGRPVKTSRDLPEIVASTPVGTEAPVVVIRDGKQQTFQVKLGELKEETQKASLTTNDDKGGADKPNAAPAPMTLGMRLAALDPAARSRFGIKAGVKGVVITEVDPDSSAANKEIKSGEVIVEINQISVTTPQEFAAQTKTLKAQGRKDALLLVASPDGDVRFVALPLD